MKHIPALFVLAALAGCSAKSATDAGRTPTLVVLVTVDQMRGDYLMRFRDQLTGGFDRLLQGGAWFRFAYQDHANTETAPGHAAAWSGRYPRHNGIVSNARGVPDTSVRLIASAGEGASPFRVRGGMFFDWLRAADPTARALSVSRKDRGAILSVGQAREAVYWFAPEGRFTTSTYYADALPDWVVAFNGLQLPERLAGRVWEPLLPDSAYAEPDSVAAEHGGGDVAFPHVLSSDPSVAARSVKDWPWMDDLTLEFALAGVDALGLGEGPGTDLLALSLSATDHIGHRYGPDSREIHDQILRLDRSLGAFLDSLGRLVGDSRIVVALTGDHGVAPFPDLYASRTGQPAGRVSLRAIMAEIRGALADRGVPRRAVRLETDLLWVDRNVLNSAGVEADSLVAVFAELARAVPGVARVDLVRALASADTASDAIARRWLHALPPDLPIEAVVTLEPHWVWAPGVDAQHGSPWDYDAHVPVVLSGAPFRPGAYADTVRVVDLVPTLAAALGIPVPERVDGHVLGEVLR
jgi:predicted AlkP superfamily pyrophosphatase or phosphodiesterase